MSSELVVTYADFLLDFKSQLIGVDEETQDELMDLWLMQKVRKVYGTGRAFEWELTDDRQGRIKITIL